MFNQQIPQPASTMNITIEKVMFIETGTHNNMHYRCWTPTVTGDLTERVVAATQHGGQVTPAKLSNIAASIIQPSLHASDRPVAIVNSWGNPRFAFILVLRHQSSTGLNTRHILSGYTDHPGGVIFNSGLNCDFDNQMRLYFTSAFVISLPRSGYGQETMVHANAIISGEYNPGMLAMPGAPQGQVTYKLRPEDIALADGLKDLNIPGMTQIADTRLMFNQQKFEFSSYANQSPAGYLSRVLNSVSQSHHDISATSTIGDLMEARRGIVAEHAISDNIALELLIRRTGLHENGSITIGELRQLDPTAMDRASLTPLANTDSIAFAGGAAYMNTTGIDVNIATSLVSMVPPLMLSLMITHIHLKASNLFDFHNPQNYYVSLPLSFCTDLNLEHLGNLLKDRLLWTVFYPLFINQSMLFDLEIIIDLLGDTVIHLSLNGETHRVTYVLPTWGASLYAPVLTNSQDQVTAAAGRLMSLATYVNDCNLSANVSQGVPYVSF